MLVDCLFVGCGGFIGSVARFLASSLTLGGSVVPAGLPINTLLINVVGSFLITFLTGLLGALGAQDSRMLLLLRVGLCGGFTTFSTFSAETLSLLESGRWAMGLAYALLSLVLCLVAALAGQVLASRLVA